MSKYLVKENEKLNGVMSVSQIITFLKCQKQWEYSYIHELTKRVEKPYFTIGRLCHYGMQGAWTAHHAGKSIEECIENGYKYMENYFEEYINTNVLLEEELTILEEIYNDSKSIFKNAFINFNPEEYEVYEVYNKTPAIELHFKIPIKRTKGFHGFIDLIVKHKKTGQIWIVDYKFRSSLAQDEDEAYNMQNAVYSKACDYLKIPYTGSMTYQHLNIPPAIPNINKDGTISRAKIRTTWEVYEKICVENGQDPLKYKEEMVEKLSSIEWNRKTLEYRSKSMLDRMWDLLIEPTSKKLYNIKNNKAKNGIYTFISMYPINCKMCQYNELCQADLRGYDTENIILIDFVRKNDKIDPEDQKTDN